ncbi:cubilin homolog [Toxorhynchites rutilus septentrionalis]|uniref:cubilin homolog n=1 Tax=Toxorhynchites rutilus septentrionalis TaxID=329112 RepID=UPI002479B323|nr:cubilin homolog [Toxorhynchites rutilus septentrionalis]
MITMKSRVKLLLLLTSIIHVQCYFENQPKILSNDGHLIIESAVDRNISFFLRGNGYLNVGDFSLGKMIQSLANVSSLSRDIPIGEDSAQLQNLIDVVKGPFGLIKRVTALENGTTESNGGRDRGRLNNINRRLGALERKVNNMITKLRENNCKTSPCQNGGTCISLYDSFVCQCPRNWEGPTCANDVNECSEFVGTDLGCQNGATCKNTPGSYSCICASGWQGIHCNSRTKDCMSSGNELCGHGTCVQIREDPGFKCICEQGWKTNGVTPACSVDVDECSESKPHCSKDPEVSCINLPGSFVCGSCPPGYSGNGFYCVDIDECQTNNGGCSTSPSVSCINLRGTYKCGSCPPGYTGDGKTCIVKSSRCSPGLCHPMARCVEYIVGVANCVCLPGYQGSGIGPNGCVRMPTNPCAFNPCKNGGTCTPNGSNYTCSCPPGTAQPNCIRFVTPCVPNPCFNGGTCAPFMDRYYCSCPAGYTGIRCQGASRSCGGILDSYSGILRYPVDNGTYNHNSRCAWLLKTNHTKILNVTFTQFHVEDAISSGECKFDWLQIHDGKTSAAHNIGRFCGNQLPNGGNLLSTRNFLYLWFRSDNSTAHDGFELHWESIDPICGGEITVKSHGILASPGSPGNYPPNRDCKWYLTAPPGKRLQFHFYTMMLESHNSCEFDYVQINDGLRDDAPMLVKYCNTSHPEPLVTPSNEATIYFHSDEDRSDAGFQISYALIEGIPGCGGTFTKPEGEINSPRGNNDNLYPHNLNCEYVIQLPVGTRIEINFNRFHLEASDSCKFDYLELFDGRSPEDPSLGKYCGNELPPVFTSSANNILFKFRTDWSTSHGGFSLNYKVQCGGVFTNPDEEITSPGYPKPYTANQQCDYLIQAPVGKAILLDFSDFDIEGNSYPSCDLDYVQIFDGYEPKNNSVIGRYCSAKPPPRAVSTLNVMLLRFVSDLSISGRGFKANYSLIDVSCGGVITSEETMIRSPSSSDRGTYLHDLDCKWLIVAPKTHAIQLSWNSFELEKSTTCTYDFVEIYDNSSQTNGFVGRYCGLNKPPAITSSGNLLTIRFKTDSSNSKSGFSLSFTFLDVRKLCGGSFYTAEGVLRSPGFPNEYTSEKVCEWIITVPMGQQIRLNVKSFIMEKHHNCIFDGLEIRNGGTASSPLIGKYCGTDDFNGLISFSNKLYLRFYSDRSRNYAGFEIEWDGTATGCGGVLNSHRGSIISPHYPEPYGTNAECSWRISISAGSSIHIVFTDLELESHSNCRYDYLEIYDGRDVSGKNLGRFCHIDTDPIQLNTESNHAYVLMRSDDTNQGRGFSLKYNILCKRNITGFEGVIESPNFPNKYPSTIDCLWTISVPPGNKIDIEFSHFELENNLLYENNKSHVCHFDYIDIIEPEDERSLSTRYCNQMPAKMTSKGSSVQIAFHTDASSEKSGFRLEWHINGCGGILTKPNGFFSSPNYPNEYPANTQCHWTLSMPPGYRIELAIYNFNMESSGQCRYDGLTISNTEDFQQVITTICHTQKDPIKLTSTGHMLYAKFFSDHTYTYKGFMATYTMIPSNCGGVLTSHQGFIYSPNYPKNYPSNQSCEWTIRTDPGYTLQFHIEDIGMVNTGNCSKDYVQVFDGSEQGNSKLLNTYCDSENITSSVSSGNQLLVVFHSDQSLEAKGFRANYSTNCGAAVNVTQAGIISLENTYKIRSENCTWILSADDLTRHVTLQIMHMNVVEVDGNCLANLTIHDGNGIDAPIRYNGCGSKIPPAIVSNGNTLTVHITSEDYNLYNVMGMQFVASYMVMDNVCGGELTSFAGEFASPNYPNSAPMNVECVWQLNASPGNKLQLYVQSLNILESEHCNTDYLEVRDGAGKLIADYCGDNPTINLTSSNSFWVKFRTSDQGVSKGFLAEYSYEHSNEVTGREGTIASPMYPRDYARNEVHSWRIIVDVGSIISMKFDAFEIDAKFYESCDGQLEIYDGYDDSAEPLKAELCGLTAPEPFKSTSNVVFIRLDHTDANGPSRFLLNWEQIGKSEQPVYTSNVDYFCGGYQKVIVLNDSDSTYNLTSPGYPNGYLTNLNCSWIFQSAISTFHPFLQLNYVDLEETNECLSDYLDISTSPDMLTWSKSDVICTYGYKIKSSFHGKPFLKVVFRTDYFNNRTGFTGKVSLRCGGVVTEPNGVIEVPSRATLYGNVNSRAYDPVCMWNITVRPGRVIELQFEVLRISKPPSEGCIGFVSVKNGMDEFSPSLGTFCGNELPGKVTTSSNRAFVKFDSNQVTSNEFRVVYREVGPQCGGQILLTKINSTVVATPNFPEIPHPHTECVWTVMAPSGEIMKYSFERLSLRYSVGCSSEYVELRDGGTSSSKSLLKYCDHDSYPSQLTTSNVLRIHYFTDNSDPGNGFKLRVSLAQCGGSIRAPSGTIQSKNYPLPGGYPMNTVCEYYIYGSLNTVLNITFEDIHLPTVTNCSLTDNIQIYSVIPEENFTDTLIGTYCGTNDPSPIVTENNQARIVFTTFNTRPINRGFKLTFSSSSTPCGSEINAPSGEIASPGYPDNGLKFKRLCEWEITVPEGRRVKIEFIDLDLSTNGVYYLQHLSFYHGFDYSARIRYVTAGYDKQPIYSSNNKMVINFWSDVSSGNRGFKLRFSSDEPSICVGNLGGSEGIIATPINQKSYLCEYSRTTASFFDTSKRIGTLAMHFSDMKAGPYLSPCTLNTSGILVKRGNSPTYLKKYCGNGTEADVVRSPFPDVSILALQNVFLGEVRFKLEYRVHTCGGMFGSELKSLMLPDLLNKTGPLECAWYVEYPENTLINIEFANFRLSQSCDEEYLLIYNGPTAMSPLLGRYCSGASVEPISTQGRHAFIEYHSGNVTRSGSFELKMSQMVAGCGGTLHKSTDVFGSPSVNGKYQSNTECVWTIRADNGYHIGFSFVGRYNIEKSVNCSKDYVEIFDRKGDEWMSLGRVCGKEIPSTYNSTGSMMRVLFRSDDTVEGDGFTIKWEQNCGGIYPVEQETGIITSPNYPLNYDRMTTCNYTFLTKEKDTFISLNFLDFSLEDGPQTSICIYDNVTIYKQMEYSDPLVWEKVGTYCKQNSPGRMRIKNRAAILFRSDRWLESRGFKFEYKLNKCGGLITKSKRIENPETFSATSGFGNGISCIWNITIPDGKKVVIRFEELELDHSDMCYYDYVHVYKGLERTSDQKLASLCGNLTGHAPAITIK